MRCNTNIGSSKLKPFVLVNTYGSKTLIFEEDYKIVVIAATGLQNYQVPFVCKVDTSKMTGEAIVNLGQLSYNCLQNLTTISNVKKGEQVIVTVGHEGWTSIIGYK